LFAVIVCAVVAAFLLWPPQPYLARKVLPDGSVLTLVAVKAGQSHESPLATFSEKLAARLPAGLRKRVKLTKTLDRTYSYYSSSYLSVWLTIESGTTQPGFPVPGPPLHVWVGDDRGNVGVSEEFMYAARVSRQVGSNIWLEGLPVLSWPRRAETIRIQVCQNDGAMLGEFRVKNPGHNTKTPPWKAPPWPITVRDGDLDFTLTSAWLGVGYDWTDRTLSVETNYKLRSTRVTFRVTKQGEVQTNWNAHFIRAIRDSTGNWSCSRYYSGCGEGETWNHFNRPPPPGDEAWRMTVEFWRVGGFDANELCVVRGVTPGVPLVVSNAFGADRLVLQWRSPSSEPSVRILTARAEPQRRDCRITLLQATDNLARNVRTSGHGDGPSVAYRGFTLSSDISSLDLVFALHRSRAVVFQVKPEFYRPPPIDAGQWVPKFRP
jgi:hypothetical protein